MSLTPVATQSAPKNVVAPLVGRACALLTVLLILFGCSKKSAVERVDSLYDQAQAAFAEKKYDEAERLALKSANEAKKSLPGHTSRIAEAFEVAGISAEALQGRDHGRGYVLEVEVSPDGTVVPQF